MALLAYGSVNFLPQSVAPVLLPLSPRLSPRFAPDISHSVALNLIQGLQGEL